MILRTLFFMLVCGAGSAWAQEQAEAPNPPSKILADLPIVANSNVLLVKIDWPDTGNNFVLHTGLTATIIDRRFRPDLAEWLGSGNLFMPFGASVASFYNAPTFRLGNCELKGKYAACVDLHPIGENIGHPIAGFIGVDAIESHVIEMNIPGNSVKIFNNIPIDIGEEWHSIDMVRVPRGWQISAALGDAGRETMERFIVDTGSSCAMTLRATAFDRLSKSGMLGESREQPVVTGGGVTHTEAARLNRIKIGRFEHDDIPVTRVLSEVSTLGIGYLRRYVVLFDFPNKRLLLRPSKDYSAPEPRNFDESGMHVIWKEEKIIVQTCYEESPAFLAGLRDGDQLIKVDGRLVSQVSLYEVRQILMQKNKTLRVEALRDGKALVCDVKLGDKESLIESQEANDERAR